MVAEKDKDGISEIYLLYNYILEDDKNASDLVLNKRFKFVFDVPKRVSNVVNTSSKKIKEYMYKICFRFGKAYFFCNIFKLLIIVLK